VTTSSSEAAGTERVVFFSDAVVAIALTLLALELPVPTGTTDSEVWHSFAEKESEYFGFLLSFAVIAGLWSLHHWLFRYVTGVTAGLMWLNFAWLLGIVLVPFVTKVMVLDGSFQLSSVAYATVVGATSLALIGMHAVARAQGLLSADTSPSMASRFRIAALPQTAFLLSIPVAFVDPDWARVCWVLGAALTLPLGRVLRRRRQPVSG
jgi:uncharacterized membrane protein